MSNAVTDPREASRVPEDDARPGQRRSHRSRESAADRSEQLSAILRSLPADWDSKNLQIVLHTRVIGNTAAQPDVVPWHVG